MSKKVQNGKLGTSDESNSTEHDATVSLSGTDEFNDTHSVFSDSISLASKASKLNDAKKFAYKINKLKEENALLKEALEKANASDITMLKSKLRGSNADLVRLRQNNLELKDRIQVLEGRLFNALSLQSTRNKGTAVEEQTNSSEQVQHPANEFYTNTSPPLDTKFTSSERAHLMDMVKSLQSRCKHLARLVQSYETKISVLQTEVDNHRSENQNNDDDNNINNSPSELNKTGNIIAFDVSKSSEDQYESSRKSGSSNTSEPLKSALKTTASVVSVGSAGDQRQEGTTTSIDRKRVKMETSKTTEVRVDEAREADLRMIKELSEEVKRLASLVSREQIRESEEKDYHKNREGDDLHSKNNESSDYDGYNEDNKDSYKVYAPPHVSGVGGRRRPVDTRDQTNAHQLYSPDHLLCSFFSGVVAMLICVAISGLSFYSVGGSLEDMDAAD